MENNDERPSKKEDSIEEDKESNKENNKSQEDKEDEEVEKAIVCFTSDGTGHILSASGIAIESTITDTGSDYSDDCGLTHHYSLHRSTNEPECGIWVWEGTPKFIDDEHGGSYEFDNGDWRKLTHEEWSKIEEINSFNLWPSKMSD